MLYLVTGRRVIQGRLFTGRLVFRFQTALTWQKKSDKIISNLLLSQEFIDPPDSVFLDVEVIERVIKIVINPQRHDL